MQEQNFEKQVRDRMDELSFVPSAPVWEKVEEQIRNKKKKRRIIFWLLPMIIGTGLGWWLLAKNDFIPINEQRAIATEYKNKTQSEATPSKKFRTPDRSTNSSITSKSKVNPLDSSESTTTIANKKEKSTRAIHSRHSNTFITKVPYNSVIVPVPEQSTDNKHGIGHEVALPSFHPISYGFDADSILNSSSISIAEIPDLDKDEEKESKLVKEDKWQVAYALAGGISGISEDFIRFGANADMLYYASPAIPSNVASPGIPPTPSQPKPGAAFIIGVDVKRKLSKRLSIVSGLHYAYYSTSIKVGSPVHRDTLIGRFDATAFRTESYYRNDGFKKDYTNKFHFIQIPIGLELKLTRKHPLHIQAGAKVEQMFSSNALFYNQNAGVYVKDKVMLTKTGVNVFGGFTYQFRSQKAFSFAVGPHVQYRINNLSKNTSNSQHLYFMGISTQIFIKNK